MSRGNRGNRGNNRGNNRGYGRGRGAPSFRGQGQGGQNSSRANGRGRGSVSRPLYHNLDLIDYDIQQYADETSVYAPPSKRGGIGRNRGRGRGRGLIQDFKTYRPVDRTPPPPRKEEGSGAATPSRRTPGMSMARGLGMSASSQANIPLWKLLAMDRPYLRPINFVPAQLTPVLFQREEEILEVENFIEPEDHVPTADQVSRVFSHPKPPPEQNSFFQTPEDLFSASGSEPVVTLDFNSIVKLLETSSIESSKHVQEGTVARNLGQSNLSTSLSFENETIEVFEKTNGIPSSCTVVKGSNTTYEAEEKTENVAVSNEETSTQNIESTLKDSGLNQNGESEEILELTNFHDPSTEQIGEEYREEEPLFVLDPNPETNLDLCQSSKQSSSLFASQPLGSNIQDEEETIIYEAPNPRSTASTPLPGSSTLHPAFQPLPSPSTPSQDSISKPFGETIFSFSGISEVKETALQHLRPRHPRRVTKKDRQEARRRMEQSGYFGNLGAALEERHLHEEEKKSERRRGSDIEWGDENSDVENISNGLGDMEIDPDLDPAAMKRFVTSMSSAGMEHTTVDDIEDDEKIRIEDEEDDNESEEDSEAEEILAAEEERLIGELGSDDEEDEDSSLDDDDDDDDDLVSFEVQLAQLRDAARAIKANGTSLFEQRLEKLRGKGKEKQVTLGYNSDSSLDINEALTWAERDEDYLDDIDDILDANAGVINGNDRRSKKTLFKAIHDGDFSSIPAKKRRDYGKDLPPDLQMQWEKDRLKKAENKRKRAAARLEAAADPFAQHKGGKKGRKDMLRASRLMAEARQEIELYSGRGSPSGSASEYDIASLILDIRAYVADIGNRGQMSLPPMDKTLRSQVHEIADAFGLKSLSKGKGTGRYTTLSKTTRTGIRINEAKIGKILRSRGEYGFTRPGNPGARDRGKGRAGAPKHREGDEVGKEAPKIGEANIGFQMLTKLGWSEGNRIGVSGGLEAPLTAIIKHTKLGLGATR